MVKGISARVVPTAWHASVTGNHVVSSMTKASRATSGVSVKAKLASFMQVSVCGHACTGTYGFWPQDQRSQHPPARKPLRLDIPRHGTRTVHRSLAVRRQKVHDIIAAPLQHRQALL